MTDEQIIEAFHAMWDGFPEPVMITQKNRVVIAVNEACAQTGLLKPGMRCSSVGGPEQHRGCLCNKAADTKQTVAVSYDSPFGKSFGYWIPIKEKPEWIIHFGVGSTHEYEKMARPVVEKIQTLEQ